MRDIASITKQAKWPVGFFDFGKAKTPDVRYFNCSVIRKRDGLWLIARRSHTLPKVAVGMNDLMAFKMTDSLQMHFGSKIRFPKTLTEQHHEDPRVSVINGRVWISANTFQINAKRTGWTGAHQCVGRATDDWGIDYVADPVYGKNGGSPLMNTGNEKNWLWFEHNGEPHMVYSSQPHVVLRMSRDLNHPIQEYVTTPKFDWDYGQIRGGTPPVRVGDEYFTFFHSSTAWTSRFRRYHMGFLAFKAEAPFEVTRLSKRPILSGSQEDEWHEGLPLVVFPCGAILENGEWLVTMGVNDCCSAWIKIPHNDLTKTSQRPSKKTEDTTDTSAAPANDSNPPSLVAPFDGFAFLGVPQERAQNTGGGEVVRSPDYAGDNRHATERAPEPNGTPRRAGRRHRLREGVGGQ